MPKTPKDAQAVGGPQPQAQGGLTGFYSGLAVPQMQQGPPIFYGFPGNSTAGSGLSGTATAVASTTAPYIDFSQYYTSEIETLFHQLITYGYSSPSMRPSKPAETFTPAKFEGKIPEDTCPF